MKKNDNLKYGEKQCIHTVGKKKVWLLGVPVVTLLFNHNWGDYNKTPHMKHDHLSASETSLIDSHSFHRMAESWKFA